jgi:hypothetical protein
MRLMNRNFSFVFGVLAAIFAFPEAGSAQSGGGSPDVRSKFDGGVQVRFGNGCWVDYDHRGRDVGHARRCHESQHRRADRAARDFLRARGQRSDNGRRGPNDPTVTNRHGAGVDVTFRNGCHIAYDRRIRLLGQSGRCRDGHYRRAADAARDYYRASGSGPGPAAPIIHNRKGSGIDVAFRNGCRISYSPRIRQIGQAGPCNRNHYRRAEAAAREYYHARGPRPGPAKPIIHNRKGAGIDVAFRNGCRISYSPRIRQIGQAGPCDRSHYRRAEEAARDYYRRR